MGRVKKGRKMAKAWIGFDLDGTIAFYDKWRGLEHVGEPIQPMIDLIQNIIKVSDYEVKIFTARANEPKAIEPIRKWLNQVGLPNVEITATKDLDMVMLYDDTCTQVRRNKGELIR